MCSSDLTRQQAADGVLALANEHMTQALRVISIQKGFDPADFALMSFGGAGGLHVCALADNLGMTQAIVPQRAGVLSAEGLVYAPRKREMLQALPEQVDEPLLHERIAQLQQQGQAELIAEGVSADRIRHRVFVDMCYRGQSSVLQIDWEPTLADRETGFHTAHQQRFGHQLGLPVEQVNLRVQSQAQNNPPAQPDRHTRSASAERLITLPGIDTPVAVYNRESLGAGQRIAGPALIYEAVGTTWLAANWHATVDSQGHLLLQRKA